MGMVLRFLVVGFVLFAINRVSFSYTPPLIDFTDHFDPSDPILIQHREKLRKMLGLSPGEPIQAIVVGGGRGIGEGFTRYLLALNANVLIVSPNSAFKAAERLTRELGVSGKIDAVKVDFSNDQEVREFLKDPRVQQAHVVVFSGGTAVPDFGSENEIAKSNAIKKVGAVNFLEYVGEQMSQKFLSRPGRGSVAGLIVSVSSLAGLYDYPFPLKNYSQANRALIDQAERSAHRFPEVLHIAVACSQADTDMTGFGLPRPIAKALGRTFGDSTKNIALTSMDAIINPDTNSGRYVYPRTIIPGHLMKSGSLNAITWATAKFLGPWLDNAATNNPATRAFARSCSTVFDALSGIKIFQ